MIFINMIKFDKYNLHKYVYIALSPVYTTSTVYSTHTLHKNVYVYRTTYDVQC